MRIWRPIRNVVPMCIPIPTNLGIGATVMVAERLHAVRHFDRDHTVCKVHLVDDGVAFEINDFGRHV